LRPGKRAARSPDVRGPALRHRYAVCLFPLHLLFHLHLSFPLSSFCFFFHFFSLCSVNFKYAYACVIHVLCNHYQLRYSTIIYYTSKRYSSCRCTLCARCRCSDDINFAPSLSSRGQPRFPFFSLPVLELAARATRMITKVPRYGKPVHTVTNRPF